MSELPCGWVQAKLGDVVHRIEAGKSFRCIELPPEAGQRGLVKISAVTWGDFREHESKTVPDGIAVDDHLRIVEGDLLISRANTIELVGACVLAIAHSRELYLSDKVLRLATPMNMRPWIKHYLATPVARKAIGAASTGNQLSMRNISQGALLALNIPLAPPAEQQRIADKLDKLLARIDACRGSLKTVKSLTQRLRQSMLLAFKSGRLGTTGSETWREVALGDVAEVGTGSTPLKSNQRFYTAEGTPWVTSAATGAPFVTGASEFVTAEAIAASRLKLYAPGTLLVAMYGEGKTRGQVTELAIEATINQACAAVVVDVNQARRDFVKLVLQAQYIELREMAEGGNQPNLNLSKVRSMRFSLPALAVQDEILGIAARLLSVTNTVEARVANVSAMLDSLTRAVLAKAFRGELVPRDPADEPAERMLERLRATEAPKAAARRRRSAGRGIDQTASA